MNKNVTKEGFIGVIIITAIAGWLVFGEKKSAHSEAPISTNGLSEEMEKEIQPNASTRPLTPRARLGVTDTLSDLQNYELMLSACADAKFRPMLKDKEVSKYQQKITAARTQIKKGAEQCFGIDDEYFSLLLKETDASLTTYNRKERYRHFAQAASTDEIVMEQMVAECNKMLDMANEVEKATQQDSHDRERYCDRFEGQ